MGQGIWYFENVNVFRILCPHKYKEFKKSHTFKTYGKDEFIYFKEDVANKMFLIASGKVKIAYYTPEGKEVVKAVLSKGEVFGELALLGEDKRNDFAQASTTQTTICPISIDQMHDLMLENKELSFRIYKLIGFRIQKLERKIESLISKDVKTRLVEFIYDLAVERGRKVGEETFIENHFTQKDIADLIGTSRQTVTTLLNELKTDNLINFDRRKILVRDLDKLTKSIA